MLFSSTAGQHAFIILGIDDDGIIFHNTNNNDGIMYEEMTFSLFKRFYFPPNPSWENVEHLCYLIIPNQPLKSDVHLNTVFPYHSEILQNIDYVPGKICISAIDKEGNLPQVMEKEKINNLDIQDIGWFFNYDLKNENGYSVNYMFNNEKKLLNKAAMVKHDVVVKVPIYNSDFTDNSLGLIVQLNFDDNIKINKDTFFTLQGCSRVSKTVVITGEEIKKQLISQSFSKSKLTVSLLHLHTKYTDHLKVIDGFEIEIPNYPE